VPADLPAGARALKKDFDEQIQKQIQTALSRGVFGVSVDDLEGMETRWKPQQSGYVVILKSQPERIANRVMLNFLDGTSHTMQPGLFDFELARKLHFNAVRVPHYLVIDSQQSGAAPDWLRQHLSKAILAVCSGDSHACQPWNGLDAPAYHLFYHGDLGLSHHRNSSASVSYQNDDESWY
jgi:hypothetical protein